MSEGTPVVGVVVVSDSVVVGRKFSAVVPINTTDKSTIQHRDNVSETSTPCSGKSDTLDF